MTTSPSKAATVLLVLRGAADDRNWNIASFAVTLDAALAMLHEEPEQPNGETKPIDRLQ